MDPEIAMAEVRPAALSGGDLDAAVAAEVMGFTIRSGTSYYDGYPMPWRVYVDAAGRSHNPIPYSSDGNAMLEVLQQMQRQGWDYLITTQNVRAEFWHGKYGKSYRADGLVASHLPSCVARAALMAVQSRDET